MPIRNSPHGRILVYLRCTLEAENAFLVALIKTDIFITAAVTTAAALISPNVCHFYRCEVGK